ncbi:hypothetical protein EV363DRAFT_90659 [Boletus edulis]|nr:hypothetical protein EV363DRAFT_90659 [Boletus edulis]
MIRMPIFWFEALGLACCSLPPRKYSDLSSKLILADPIPFLPFPFTTIFLKRYMAHDTWKIHSGCERPAVSCQVVLVS